MRILLRGLYVVALAVCFAVCAYASFKIFVRSGVTPVPELEGRPEAEAVAVLADQGLEVRRIEGGDRFDPEVAAGSVVRQDPPPHTLVKRGSAVAIVLSLGPEQLTVPDLAGSALPAAQVALAAAGLVLGRTLQVFSGREVGTVVGQFPAAGTTAAPLAEIDLLLSQGDDSGAYLMPDLVYRDYDDAKRFFLRRGFRLGSVKFEVYEGARPGVILRQFPLAGHPVTRRDAVSLVVAAPADAQRPDIG